MKYREMNLTCGCCGACQYEKVRGSHFEQDHYLDGKPVSKMFLSEVQLCDSCHYTAFSIEGVVSEEVKALVASEQYKKIIRLYSPYRNYQAMAILAEQNQEKIDVLFQWCWSAEFDENYDVANEVRREINRLLYQELEENPLVETGLLLIDSLRQLEEYEEAKELLESLAEVMEAAREDEPELYCIFKCEKKSVVNHNSAAILCSQVVK